MKQYLTHSENETRKLAKKIAKKITHGVIALTGELGVGKTAFVQGFTQGLKIKEKIISPTFVLIRQHKIPKSKNTLFHIDLYRLENLKDLKQLGLKEIFSNPNNIILIEWAEKAESLMPKKIVRINIEKLDHESRKISIIGLPS